MKLHYTTGTAKGSATVQATRYLKSSVLSSPNAKGIKDKTVTNSLNEYSLSRNVKQPFQPVVKCMATFNAMPVKKETTLVDLHELRNLCSKALVVLGYTQEEISTIVEVLMHAQLRDNNQGIVKITAEGLNRHPSAAEPVVERSTRLSALINGNNSSGMVVLKQAVKMAAERAESQGFGIVGTHHTCSSTGILSYYAELLGKQGLLGFVLAQSPEYVAPYGAREAVFGTNPIAISVPANTASGAVTMDMATSAYAWFGLLEAQAAGRSIPADVAMDSEGRATTDPSEVLKGGALRVFDRSHKGSALALMVELLAGPLVGAAVADKLEEKNWGNLVVAINPNLLGDPDTIRKKVQVVLDRVKNAERVEGVDEILLPGERGDRLAAQRLAEGKIPVETALLTALRAKASPASQAPTPGGTSGLRIATRLVHGTSSVVDPYHGSGPPLWQTATFAQPSATTMGEYDYTRSGNPTRTMLQEQFSALEGGHSSYAFTTGMASLAAVVGLVKAGEHILAGDDIYGGTSRLLSQVVPHKGVDVSNVNMTDLSAVRAAIIPGRTTLVMVESPTNPRMQVCDIKAIAAIARAAGAICCVDNSIMAPTFQRPLDLGADIVMTSGTKFVGGHGDVSLGLLTVSNADLGKRIYFLQNAEGSGLAPFDCWLALRGLKTMSLRMERSAANAAALAEYLERHPLIRKVNYAGSRQHPAYDLHMRQATSGGSLLSFETGSLEASRVIVEETKLFKVTVSFGNVASLISLPCYMSHASIPSEVRAARGLPDDLVRISAGIEDIDDLISDLDQAMEKAMKKVGFVAAINASSTSHAVSAPSPHASASLHSTPLTSQQPPVSPDVSVLLERIQALEKQVTELSQIPRRDGSGSSSAASGAFANGTSTMAGVGQ